MARIRARRGNERAVAGAMQENKITKNLLKRLILQEYHGLYEDEDDDMARAQELARDYTSQDDVERGEYEETMEDFLPQPEEPMMRSPFDERDKTTADRLYRIKKLIDDLDMPYMQKLEYFNQILRSAIPEDDM